MDPQSLAFQPQSEVWQLTSNMRNVQETQQEHNERLSRLERRHEEESRLKSVWGPTSPFPGVLSSTPQHGKLTPSRRSSRFFGAETSPSPGPTRHQSTVDFAGFDDDQTSNNMVRSLHLDTDDEPRRLGATSRANSVRFDESAKWSHASRNSIDLSRTSTGLPGLGGHPMFERASSHKSDGRHSSAGQSAVSGRANSLGLESTTALSTAPMQPPGLAPGLFILGSVPSIIRCWLTTNWKHEALLYAAVCSGSYKSFLDRRLIDDLDMTEQISQDINGDYKFKVPVYLPEAVPHPSSSRSTSPAPQLPVITVDFTVADYGEQRVHSKAIQIFIGSDLLRAHNADILLSSNSMTIFDDDRAKLSIPLVRPENDATFKSLYITSGSPSTISMKTSSSESSIAAIKQQSSADPRNGDTNHDSNDAEQTPKAEGPQSSPKPGLIGSRPGQAPSDQSSPEPKRTVRVSDDNRKPSLGRISTEQKPDEKDLTEPTSAITSSSRTSSSPAIWNNNWRRESNTGAPPVQGDWANVSRNPVSRTTFSVRSSREGAIKVLRPTRQPSKSSNAPPSASPTVTGQSRFFDDGKRRNGDGPAPRSANMSDPATESLKRTSSVEVNSKSGTKENTSTSNKPRTVNPVGGASAFSWLGSANQQEK